jgi:hypothetical protein
VVDVERATPILRFGLWIKRNILRKISERIWNIQINLGFCFPTEYGINLVREMYLLNIGALLVSQTKKTLWEKSELYFLLLLAVYL